MIPESEARDREAPWLVALVMLATVAVAAVWFPVLLSFSHLEINTNEGWNAYRQKMAADGVPLYGSAPQFTVTNYPPLSFHFIGLLGKLNGDVVQAGRMVSLVSILLIALLIAAMVRRLAGKWQAGAYAALSWVMWLGLFQPDRIGMNDPQLLATVLSLLGVWAYLRGAGSNAWLCGSAVVFVVSLFTKHNLLAFPLAVGAHLLWTREFRRFAVWAGVAAATAGVLVLAVLKVDGPFFFAHLLTGRPYSYGHELASAARYLSVLQIPAAVAAVWAVWSWKTPERRLLALALVAAHAIAFAFCGGYGVDYNIFFDCILADVMILGVAASDVMQAAQNWNWGEIALTAALVVPLAGAAAFLPDRMMRDVQGARSIPHEEDDFAQAVAYVAGRPGRVYCNDLLICFEAGKPEEMMTYFVSSQLGTGKLPEADVKNLIDTYRFNTIELRASGKNVVEPGQWMGGVAKDIGERYRVGLYSGGFALLIPATE